jgi:hypothetical protein
VEPLARGWPQALATEAIAPFLCDARVRARVGNCGGGGAPGTAHRFWNAGEEEARFFCEVRPALQFESLIETMFTLAGDGKTNRKGLPNPLRLAVIARAHFETVRLPAPPAAVQRAALAVSAPVGKAVGYEATRIRPTRGRRARPTAGGRTTRRPGSVSRSEATRAKPRVAYGSARRRA